MTLYGFAFDLHLVVFTLTRFSFYVAFPPLLFVSSLQMALSDGEDWMLELSWLHEEHLNTLSHGLQQPRPVS